ncbi:MAG TPA: BolA family protein [Steroidobacteraceae bacterium]|jgi:BolA protein|nr:BolA family protein [Steroidobacteraceae bacterium]
MTNSRYDMICERLTATLAPESMQLQDDSHLHAGHAGAKSGGHYTLRIVSTRFAGMRSVARHQLVYRSLGELMQTDIHALSITALTPNEVAPDELTSDEPA